MIKLIAMDMDGTLLNEEHCISEDTLRAIQEGIDRGIHFVIATGRTYKDAKRILSETPFHFDYITSSGAEIWSKEGLRKKRVLMNPESFEDIYQRLIRFPVAISFCSGEKDYMIGTEKEILDYLVAEYQFFFRNASREEILKDPVFIRRSDKTIRVDHVSRLRKMNIPILKIFVFSYDESLIADMEKALEGVLSIASASSFRNNLELTHADAQKGTALEEYAEHHGYPADQIMAIGDSLNDYSMLSMDFGATVAMANAAAKIKEVSKYHTLSNREDGVAHAIRRAISNKLQDLQ